MRIQGMNMRRIGILMALVILVPAVAKACDVSIQATVPITLLGRTPLVTVQVDGQPARFVLDTGSTHSLLRGPRGRAHAGRPYRLVVGPREITAFDFVAMDAGPPGVDGLLGQNFFEGRRVLLDFPGRRMWMDA